jgi:hypothetical protein
VEDIVVVHDLQMEDLLVKVMDPTITDHGLMAVAVAAAAVAAVAAVVVAMVNSKTATTTTMEIAEDHKNVIHPT